MSETKTDYTVTYTSFSGADATPTLNGTCLPEVQEIKYKESLQPHPDKPPVEGEIHQTLFSKEPVLRSLIRYENTLVIFFGNEYGQKSSMRFDGVVFENRTGGVSVDSIHLTEVYRFTAEAVTIDDRNWFFDLNTMTYSYADEDTRSELHPAEFEA